MSAVRDLLLTAQHAAVKSSAHLQAAAANIDATLAERVGVYRSATNATQTHLTAATAHTDAWLTQHCSGYRPWQLLLMVLAAGWLLPRLVAATLRQLRLFRDKGIRMSMDMSLTDRL
jgi:hypothetical protein